MGFGVGTGVGEGSGVGTGVPVGLGVNVGSGVFSSIVGGRSSAPGGSVVRKVENIPGGGVGEEAGLSSEPPQAIIASITSAPAKILTSAPKAPLPVFTPNMSFTPGCLSGRTSPCLTTLPVRAD